MLRNTGNKRFIGPVYWRIATFIVCLIYERQAAKRLLNYFVHFTLLVHYSYLAINLSVRKLRVELKQIEINEDPINISFSRAALKINIICQGHCLNTFKK